MSGLELIRRIRSEFPGVAVLVLSMHGEEQYAMRSFKGEASCYVTKDSASTRTRSSAEPGRLGFPRAGTGLVGQGPNVMRGEVVCGAGTS